MRSVLLGLLTVFLTATTAFAQFDAAAVVGTVRDSTDAVVPGTKVSLTNTETKISTEKLSAENGTFEFSAVRPGTYVVTGEKTGFALALVDAVQVQVGARLRVDLKMPVSAVSERV